MNLPVVLDIAIGLIFIYLIASLLASEIQELLAALLQWRAKHLKESIQNLIAGGYGTQDSDRIQGFVDDIYSDPLIKNINQSSKGFIARLGQAAYQLFYSSNKIFGASRTAPSYISSETFATSLLEQVGMASLIDKLTQIRLEKFIGRIVGLYRVAETIDPDSGIVTRSITIPAAHEFVQKDNWEKGSIRVLAEKARALVPDHQISGETAHAVLTLDSSNSDFMALVEEYDDLLMDFKAGQIDIQTAVERIQEGLELFINQVGEKNPAKPVDGARAATTHSTFNALEKKQLDYFQKRLKALNTTTFGEHSSRAIASGRLRPNLLEIAEVFDRSSMTYEEIEQAYQDAKSAYEAGMRPETVQPVLAEIVIQVNERIRARGTDTTGTGNIPLSPSIAIADLLSDDYMPYVEEFLQSLPSREQNLYRQTYRGWKEYQQVVLKVIQSIADQLQNKPVSPGANGAGQLFNLKNQILLPTPPLDEEHIALRDRDRYVVKRWQELDGRTLSAYVKHSLAKLFDEERNLYISTALNQLPLGQRQVFKNYQTYDQIQDLLSRVPAQVKQSLAILARRAYVKAQTADQQLNQFKEEVSVWFDRSMSRASGVYKRNAKLVAIVLGSLIALLINVDTFHIISRLSNDQSLRQVVVQKADRISQQAMSNPPSPTAAPLTAEPMADPVASAPSVPPSATSSEQVRESQLKTQLQEVRDATDAALQDVALPIQWTPANLRQQLDCPPNPAPSSPLPANQPVTPWQQLRQDCDLGKVVQTNPLSIPRMLLGWLISGLAIAMGAPFWFDLLSKIMNVRNTGNRPASTVDRQNSNPPR